MTKARTWATAANSSIGDLLTDLAGGVERPGQRHVADQRHPRLLGPLPDLGGDRAGPSGDDLGCTAVRVVLQRDGDVGRVDQHDVGRRDVGHHPAAGGGELS